MNSVALLGSPLTSMFLASVYVKLDLVTIVATGANDEAAPRAEAVLMLLLYLLSQDAVVQSVPEIVALVRRAPFFVLSGGKFIFASFQVSLFFSLCVCRPLFGSISHASLRPPPPHTP